MKETEKKFLEAFEMWYWRSTEKIRRTGWKTNAKVEEERNIITAIKQCRCEMIDRVL